MGGICFVRKKNQKYTEKTYPLSNINIKIQHVNTEITQHALSMGNIAGGHLFDQLL
jgi:hypothetical protein